MTGAVLFASALPLLLAPIRARVLGPVGRGEFAYFQASLSVISALSALGIRHAIYAISPNSEDRIPVESGSLWVITLGLSLLIGIPLALIGALVLDWPVGIAVAVLALAGPLFALTQIQVGRAQLRGDRLRVAAFASTPSIVELVGNVVLLAAQRLTIATAMTATIASEFGRTAAALLTRRMDRDGRDASSVTTAKQFILLSWRFAPATFVPVFASNVDSLIFGALAPTNLVGLYSVAKMGSSLLVLVALTLEGVFLRAASSRGTRITLFWSTPIVFGLAAVGSLAGFYLIPPLFGRNYTSSAHAFPLAALAGVVGSLYVWLSALCAARGLQASSLVSAIVVFAAMIVACVGVAKLPYLSPLTMTTPLLFSYTIGAVVAFLALRKRVSLSG